MSNPGWLRLLSTPRSISFSRQNSPGSDPPPTALESHVQWPFIGSRRATQNSDDEHRSGRSRHILGLSGWHDPSQIPRFIDTGPSSTNVMAEEPDRVWHNPNLDQTVDALLVALMSLGPTESLPAEYNSFILQLLEGYGKIRKQASDSERKNRRLQTRQLRDEIEMKEWLAAWRKEESRLLAEVERLQTILSQKLPQTGQSYE